MTTTIGSIDLQTKVPSIFTTSPSPKMTERYSFVPTYKILESFDKEGWVIDSAKQMGKSAYAAHEIRLHNGAIPHVGDSFIQAIIRNSHNGFMRLSISAGLFRLVCSNGLAVPTSMSGSIRLKHMKIEIDSVKEITDEFATKYPVIEKSVLRMQQTELSDMQLTDFVSRAMEIRWEKEKMPDIKQETILEAMRDDDQGNSVWKVFNRVQEKFVRGGLTYQGPRRSVTTKELKNFKAIDDVNTSLWTLAESYC